MDRSHPKLTAFALLSGLVLSGCATVHQLVGTDREKAEIFTVESSGKYSTDTSGTEFRFNLSPESAIDIILEVYYDLEIPVYHPLVDSSQEKIRLTSGSFVAQLGIDCGESRGSFAWGHGSELANGIIEIEIQKKDLDSISVQLRTNFWRTESTSGEYGSTSNLYFESTGRIEREILDRLLGHEQIE